MAYYDTIYLVQGDSLPEVRVTLLDSANPADGQILDDNDVTTWKPINLTGATVKIKLRELGAETLSSTITASVDTPATEGRIFFQFANNELDVTAGVYEGEIEITYDSGFVQTVYDKLKFSIREQF